MLNKLKNDRNTNKGFTIIEVLIVLAIAGLILLVVFLAVPALQRNQRNSGYKSEANRILAAAQEVSANNGGAVLTTSSCSTVAPLCSTVPVTLDAQRVFQASNAKNVNTLAIEPKGSTTNTGPTLTSAVIVTGAKCPSALLTVATGPLVTLAVGTTRQTVLVYAVEDNAGLVIGQCQES